MHQISKKEGFLLWDALLSLIILSLLLGLYVPAIVLQFEKWQDVQKETNRWHWYYQLVQAYCRQEEIDIDWQVYDENQIAWDFECSLHGCQLSRGEEQYAVYFSIE